MDQRLSLITLGVADIERSTAFYRHLGWTPALVVEETVFFQVGPLVLWGRDKLAADIAVQDGGGWGGITLAHNVGSEGEVDSLIDEARAAEARITREPGRTFYGGYAGVFVDPDGHPWEIAFNPRMPLAPDGSFVVPE